jgi:hypothetical protein
LLAKNLQQWYNTVNMTEVPEHLKMRSIAARAKADAIASEFQSERLPTNGIPAHLIRKDGDNSSIPLHLLLRSQAAKAKADAKAGIKPKPVASSGIDTYVDYKARLQIAVTARQANFADSPITQLVLESLQGSQQFAASMSRFIKDFTPEAGWEYQKPIPKSAQDGLSSFSNRLMTRGMFDYGRSFQDGGQAVVRAWALLSTSELDVVEPIPDHLGVRLAAKAFGRVGIVGGVKAGLEGTITYELMKRATDFKIPAAFDDAITSFDTLLSAPEDSDEWGLNHWKAKSNFGYEMTNTVHDRGAFNTGARLVASLIKA